MSGFVVAGVPAARRAGRQAVLAGACACLLAALLVPAGDAWSAGAPVVAGPVPVAGAGAPDAAAAASARARRLGWPVEILADRTDWAQTFAEPGGGFEAQEYLEPQRVREADGSWAAVSTSLSVRPGGVVAPGAITTGLTLSDGGRGPLFTLAQGGRSLSVSSPFGSLPAPSLSGSTATYRDVLPGVDLLVTAAPTGVSEVIEVKSAAAAADPEWRGSRSRCRSGGCRCRLTRGGTSPPPAGRARRCSRRRRRRCGTRRVPGLRRAAGGAWSRGFPRGRPGRRWVMPWR